MTVGAGVQDLTRGLAEVRDNFFRGKTAGWRVFASNQTDCSTAVPTVKTLDKLRVSGVMLFLSVDGRRIALREFDVLLAKLDEIVKGRTESIPVPVRRVAKKLFELVKEWERRWWVVGIRNGVGTRHLEVSACVRDEIDAGRIF